MEKNDLEALRAAFRGLMSTAARLQQMEPGLDELALRLDREGHAASADMRPDDALIRAATAHAIAAAAFSGLLHRLFTPGGVPPAPRAVELTDSAGESAP